MGYGKVYLTADHGFVITGILDEADKIPVPDGDIIKSEERFCLANDTLDNENIIVRSQKYKESQYQYYANRTNRLFQKVLTVTHMVDLLLRNVLFRLMSLQMKIRSL